MYLILFCSLVVVSVWKASMHFLYLKEIKPEEYLKTESFIDSFFLSGFSLRVQALIFPFFIRTRNLEKANSSKMIKSVYILLVFQIVVLLFLGILIIIKTSNN